MTGQCTLCHRVWTLDTEQGVCQWCGKPSSCQTSQVKTRKIKPARAKKQALVTDKGYDRLKGDYLTFYNVASRFSQRAKAEDREDLLHDIILTLADVERNNGHKPLTLPVMYRIASRSLADYWRAQYKLTNGLDCGSCSQAQRKDCKEHELYTQCPKAIKLEYLEKPIIDSEGNITELGELIADDKALDLDGWVSDSTWQIGYKPRLVEIAYKLKAGEALTQVELNYLCRWRKREQKKLF